jgi:hypothetical protein
MLERRRADALIASGFTAPQLGTPGGRDAAFSQLPSFLHLFFLYQNLNLTCTSEQLIKLSEGR